jgi:hypothetical protein
MSVCAIMQPTYLPWLGYFDLIRKSDVFVIYDQAQFEKQSWQQRNRIRTKDGEIMLTVPVLHGKGLERIIAEVELDRHQNALRKHLNSIRLSYARARNFELVFGQLEEIYQQKHIRLMDLNMELLKWGMRMFKIDTSLIYSSALGYTGTRVEALLDICRLVKADHYYSPAGSKGYIDENNLFENSGIQLTYQQYQHPVYDQIQGGEFISHLSFIDYLFNSPDWNIFA